MNCKPAITAAILVFVAAVAPGAEPEMKGTPSELRQYLGVGARKVVLTGQAKQSVQADVGHVTVVVHTQAKDLTAAIAANAQRREAMAQAIQSQGIDAKAIHAQKFSNSPQFSWFGKTPSSFEVVNKLTVDVTDEHQLMIVTAAGTNPPDLTIGAITFEYSKQREMEEQVRKSAFDDALSKKGFYEQRLAATLRPIGFQFSDMSARGTNSDALEEIVVTGSQVRLDMPPPPAAFAPMAGFDEKNYQVSVSVIFSVEPVATTH